MAVFADDPLQPISESPPLRRGVVLDVALIALIGLVVQGFWAWRVAEPTYMDSYYYTTNGQRLASGEGFTEMIIWQYLDNPGGLPTPSHTYWMPLASLLAAAGNAIRGDFRGAQGFFWILGGLVPLLAYLISRSLSGERWQAWTAALFTAAGGFYAAFMAQPTTFVPFAWAGASCLLFTGWATFGLSFGKTEKRFGPLKGRQARILFLLAAGITAGAAHLTRADGLLFLLVAVVVWMLYGSKTLEKHPLLRRSTTNSETPNSHALQLAAGTAFILAGYLAIMGFWLLRDWRVLGSPLPTGGSQSIFLTTYDDVFAYGRQSTLQSFLEWGLANIIKSRLNGLSVALQTYVAVVCLIFLTPFVIVGLVKGIQDQRQRGLLTAPVWYASGLFLIMALIFTFPGIRGSLFHSSIALWPWSMALAASGVGFSVEWVSVRRSHWQPEKAKRRFAALFVIVAFALSFMISWPRSQIQEPAAIYQEISAQLPDEAIVMTGNAPAFYYHTGHAAINVPNEPPSVIVEVGRRFGAGYLVLDENHPLPLVDLYHGRATVPDIKLLKNYGSLKLYELNISGS